MDVCISPHGYRPDAVHLSKEGATFGPCFRVPVSKDEITTCQQGSNELVKFASLRLRCRAGRKGCGCSHPEIIMMPHASRIPSSQPDAAGMLGNSVESCWGSSSSSGSNFADIPAHLDQSQQRESCKPARVSKPLAFQRTACGYWDYLLRCYKSSFPQAISACCGS